MTGAPRVVIIGAGVGGLALAQALTSAGVGVEVYERNSDATNWRHGHRLHIDNFGSSALHRCVPRPVWEMFLDTAISPGTGLAFHTHNLKELLFVDQELMSGAAASGPHQAQYAISRMALRTLLLSGLNEVVHFGREFERYEIGSDGTVTAFFADGTSATGDVLIGADGSNSRVRQQLLPLASRVEMNAVGVGGRLPLNDETRAWLPLRIQRGLNIVLPPSTSFLFSAVFDRHRHGAEVPRAAVNGLSPGREQTSRDHQDYVLWGFGTHSKACPPDTDRFTGDELQGLVGRRVGGWHPDLRRMVADTDPSTVEFMRFKTSTPVKPWTTTRVTLLGDAIHNMTPVMGLGANTALRDAALLAHQLTAVRQGGHDLVPAVHDYERRMLSYGLRAVRTSASYARRFTSRNPLPRLGLTTWLRLCAAGPLIKRTSFSRTYTDDLSPAR